MVKVAYTQELLGNIVQVRETEKMRHLQYVSNWNVDCSSPSAALEGCNKAIFSYNGDNLCYSGMFNIEQQIYFVFVCTSFLWIAPVCTLSIVGQPTWALWVIAFASVLRAMCIQMKYQLVAPPRKTAASPHCFQGGGGYVKGSLSFIGF